MAMNLPYVFRETWANLTRNITLTMASVLTVAVSLAILGCTIIVQRGAGNMTREWDGGIQFMVYVDPEATPQQIDALRTNLEENALVKRAPYVDQDETYEDFKRLFEGREAMLKSVEPEQLPTKFKVEPVQKDDATVADLVSYYEKQPNVFAVRAALDVIKQMKSFTRFLNYAFAFVSVVLIFASVLLILNTVRTAMFARRREIEVMKLVGATNWFIRVPFMAEGLVHGLVGGVAAAGGVVVVRQLLEGALQRTDRIAILQNFTVSDGDLILACLIVLGMAMFISVLSSAMATRRFLSV